MNKKLLSVLILTLISLSIFAQEEQETEIKQEKTSYEKSVDVFKRGLRLDLNKEKTSYFKTIIGIQTWWRAGETNPGTIDKLSQEPINNFSDFAMRRIRTMFYANIEGKYLLFAHFGATSDGTYSSIYDNVYVHDFQGQMKIADKSYVGGGIHFWQGLSRLSRVGSNNYLILDNPGFNFPEVNRTDAIVRQMGVFVRGVTLKKLGYQFSINKPIISADAGTVGYGGKPMNEAEMESFANNGQIEVGDTHLLKQTNYNYNGYLFWQFWDIESQSVSGASQMNYFGQKRVFNIGAGFQYQPGGTGTYKEDINGDFVMETNNITKFAADVFLSTPLGHSKGGLTAYAVYYNYQYGDDYLRTSHVLGGFAASDPNSTTPPQGAGFAQFSHGTGSIFHTEIGYTLPQTIYDSEKKIQPFVAFTYKNLEGLDEASFQSDYGVNWAIIGQNVKLTAAYSLRPIYMENDKQELKVTDNAGLFVMQLQLRI
ncbi:hypothetical protein [Flammeovirga kamogawensis]|uniref:Porin n=1 Tax=Flammeovirga kamogawensis TaxID=373891 RepID=A0ABX8GRQ6_9BACT|nr:hypothetical protein [Flammeovirga kamogawensis]MBB6463206.1 hypothetical protein [Flammeovirga kamogawensis]QWG05942.1 hypothetical protein KM029_11235 [Flammeovirga kamogawensis]TRX67767.1 hypothetical protein EO216_06245 [Flammeovirga kamogawensis]